MNIKQNTPKTSVNPSRRGFLIGLAATSASVTLALAGKNSDLPQEDRVNIRDIDKKNQDLIKKSSLFKDLEYMRNYFKSDYLNFETIDGIKIAKIQNGKDILNIQIGNGFLMGDDCLLIQGTIDSMNVDIIYKDGIVKSRKRSMNYRELNDVVLWANNNINKS